MAFPVVDDPKDVAPAPMGGDPALDSLEDRIATVRKVEDARLARDHAPLRDARSSGWNIASTMVGYPLGGIIIGLGLDNVFDTLPWITIGLMFLACFGACLQVVRTHQNRAE